MNLTLRNVTFGAGIYPGVALHSGKSGSFVKNVARVSASVGLITGVASCSSGLPPLPPGPSEHVSLPDVMLHPDTGLVRVHDKAMLPASLRKLVDAVGLTSNGCTATHVGGGKVLTAGHCLETQASCSTTVVHWGYLAGRAPSLTSRCSRVLSNERELGLDYAFFEIDHAPEAALAVGPAPLAGAFGHAVTMLGYPSGAPLHWSGLCQVLNPPELPGGLYRSQADALLFHQCPTRRGSSGSPLIDLATLRLVGIHSGSLPPWSIATPLGFSRSPVIAFRSEGDPPPARPGFTAVRSLSR